MIPFLLPFKGLSLAKTRWRMEGEERESLLLELLEHNLATVAAVVGNANTILVSPDASSFARFPRLRHLQVRGGGLNGDLEQARSSLGPVEALGVLLPDLPELKTADIEMLLDASSAAQVTLCPDLHRVGTNAMVLRPSGCLEYLFEGASFERHRDRALDLGRTIRIVESCGLANDCDELDELRRLPKLCP